MARAAGLNGIRAGLSNALLMSGTVAPEGNIIGSVGDKYQHSGGREWIKEIGNGTNTGWRWVADSTDLVFGPAQCPVGWGIDADTILSTVATQQVSGISGQVRFMPIEIGPAPQTFDALAIQVTTAEAGGAGVVHRGGLYSTVADGSVPNLNGGLLGDCSFSLTSTGQKIVQFASPITPPPGRYWLAWYNYWTTAPTTLSTVMAINNALNLPRPLSTQASQVSRALVVSGLTSSTLPNSLASPTFTSSADTFVAHIAHLLMRRSA